MSGQRQAAWGIKKYNSVRATRNQPLRDLRIEIMKYITWTASGISGWGGFWVQIETKGVSRLGVVVR